MLTGGPVACVQRSASHLAPGTAQVLASPRQSGPSAAKELPATTVAGKQANLPSKTFRAAEAGAAARTDLVIAIR